MAATVSHFELPAGDPERAASFYRRVFGWRVEPLPWEAGPGLYFTVRTGAPEHPRETDHRGAIQGGLAPPEVVGAGHPLLVVHVDGPPLEAWIESIAEAGGAPAGDVRQVGEMGTFARFRDPEGNLLGLWRPAD